MAHATQIRTEDDAGRANWPCHWCIHGEILKETMGICADCRRQECNSKPTEFKVTKDPR